MTADNHNAIAVFVDALTKYTVVVPCTKESSGADWAHMFKDHVHVHFGLPDCLTGAHNLLAGPIKSWLSALATNGN